MFSTMGFYFVLRGSDQLSRHIRTATNSMKTLGGAAVKNTADLDKLDARARHFFGSAAKWGMATMGLARGLKSVTKAYGDFELIMKRTELTMGLSASQNKALAQSFQNMAEKTEWGATSLAKGAKTLAQAGFSLKEIQSALPVMADMMTVGEIKSGEASDLMIQTLRGFNIGTDELRKTMDQMTYVSMKTPMSLQAMVQGMQYGTRGAASFGASLQDMVITTGLIYPVVMKAGGSYQVFTRAMTRLAAPTGKAAKLLKKMNVQLRDETGTKLKPWVMFDNTLKAVRKLDKAQQDLAMNTIFGFRGMSVAALEHAQALDANNKKHKGLIAAANALQSGMKGSDGYLKQSADALRDQWTKEVERAKAVWDNFKIALGSGVIYVFKPLLSALSGIAKALVDLNKASDGAFGKFMGGVLAIATIGAAGRTMLMFGRGLSTIMKASTLLPGLLSTGAGTAAGAGVGAAGGAATGALGVAFSSILRWGGPIALIAAGVDFIAKTARAAASRKAAENRKSFLDKNLMNVMASYIVRGGPSKNYNTIQGTGHEKLLGSIFGFRERMLKANPEGMSSALIAKEAGLFLTELRSQNEGAFKGIGLSDAELTGMIAGFIQAPLGGKIRRTKWGGEFPGLMALWGEGGVDKHFRGKVKGNLSPEAASSVEEYLAAREKLDTVREPPKALYDVIGEAIGNYYATDRLALDVAAHPSKAGWAGDFAVAMGAIGPILGAMFSGKASSELEQSVFSPVYEAGASEKHARMAQKLGPEASELVTRGRFVPLGVGTDIGEYVRASNNYIDNLMNATPKAINELKQLVENDKDRPIKMEVTMNAQFGEISAVSLKGVATGKAGKMGDMTLTPAAK